MEPIFGLDSEQNKQKKEYKYTSYPDFTFIIKNAEFYVDKKMASDNSKYIQAMFNDKDVKELELTDVKPSIFNVFCEYAHTPVFSKYLLKIPDDRRGDERKGASKFLLKLIEFCHKYDVQGLMNLCENYLIKKDKSLSLSIEQKMLLASDKRLKNYSKFLSDKFLDADMRSADEGNKILLQCRSEVLLDIINCIIGRFGRLYDKMIKYRDLLNNLSNSRYVIMPADIRLEMEKIKHPNS